MQFTVGRTRKTIRVRDLVLAGWTGRDRAALEHHIRELEALGVKRPKSVPVFYRVGVELLSSAAAIDVVGHDSSGEGEFVLLAGSDGLYVGVGSDQTDRKVEAYGVTVSKQMCPKLVGPELWRFGDVHKHWDRLVLRSHVTRGGSRRLYQEGEVAKMLAPQELIARYAGGRSLAAGTVMFSGTIPVRGEIGGGEKFEVELHDPVRKRSLRHAYKVRELEIAD